MELLVTFETVSAALDAEILCRGMGIPCRIIPVPRSLSVSCGYALSVEAGDTAGTEISDTAGFCGDLRRRGAVFVRVFRGVEKGGYELFSLFSGPAGTPGGAGMDGAGG